MGEFITELGKALFTPKEQWHHWQRKQTRMERVIWTVKYFASTRLTKVVMFLPRIYYSYQAMKRYRLDLIRSEYFDLMYASSMYRDAMAENGHIEEFDAARLKLQKQEYHACLDDAQSLFDAQFSPKGSKFFPSVKQMREELKTTGRSYLFRRLGDRLTPEEREFDEKVNR